MKRSLLTLMMATFSLASMAQQGSMYVGGVVGFRSSTSNPTTGVTTVSSSWAFAPEAGTFLADDLQVGLALGITGSSDKSDGDKVESFTSISPTAYVRKFFKVTDNFSTFAGFYLNYTAGTDKDLTTTPEEVFKYSGIGARIGIGVAYALSPRFTAVGQYGLLGFQSLSYKQDGNNLGKITDIDFGVNTVGSSNLSQGNNSGSVFNIGLYYTFLP